MKKLLLLFSMVALAFNASADNYLTIDDVRVRPGGSTNLVVRYHFDSELICAYQLDIQVPSGITLNAGAENGETIDKTWTIGRNKIGDGHYRYATFSYGEGEDGDDPSGNIPVTDHEGVLLYIPLSVDATLTAGTELEGTLYDVVLPENTGGDFKPEPVTFKIYIDDDAVDYVLDEMAKEAPTAKTDANVKVLRTINANEWSTICLPFAMTDVQVKETFGNDVKIAKISSTTPYELEDNPDYIYRIDVNFTSVNSIDANTPYIIKTSAYVSEFVVLHVNVAPTATPRAGTSAARMYGNYVNGINVPEFSLFLADNKFWYSTGATKIKGLRGYFTLRDILTKVDDAGAKVNMVFDGEITGISNIEQGTEEKAYSVDGIYMGTDTSRLQRGVYIVNGKKVVKK